MIFQLHNFFYICYLAFHCESGLSLLCFFVCLFIYFQECERSSIVPYLQANKLACNGFLDAGRGIRLRGLNQRTLLFLAGQTAWDSFDLHWFLVSPKSHRNDAGGPRWIPAYAVGCAIAKECWALGIHHFYSRWKQSCSLSGVWKALPHLWGLLAAHTALRNGLGREWSKPVVLMRMCWLPLPAFYIFILVLYILRDFCFIQWVIIYYPSLLMATGSSFNTASVLLICVHHSLSSFLLFGTRYYRLY